METSVNMSKAGQYLTFTLKKQDYGVPISRVREINRVVEITPVPETPSYVVGVINLRGKVIPVMDLRLRFNMQAMEYTRETCIIVIENERGQVGMIVDSVKEVVELSEGDIEPPPPLGEKSKLNFVMGMGKTEEKVIILVDIEKVVSDEAFVTDDSSNVA